MENDQIRLEWVEEQLRHYTELRNQIQRDIAQLEIMKADYINFLDGFEAEYRELASMQFAMV